MQQFAKIFFRSDEIHDFTKKYCLLLCFQYAFALLILKESLDGLTEEYEFFEVEPGF